MDTVLINSDVLDKMLVDYKEIAKIFGNILDAPSKGGNISVKSESLMCIKASGEDLKKDHKVVIVKDGKFAYTYESGDLSEVYHKPSMEIGLHNLYKNKYVAHYHPVYVLPYLCNRSYIFEYDVVEFEIPGTQLMQRLKEGYSYKEYGVTMLRNHGVVVYAECIEFLRDKHRELRQFFMQENNNIYTPDDAVDNESDELWMFRNVIENIAHKNRIKLEKLPETIVRQLLNLPDEKYRQSKM